MVTRTRPLEVVTHQPPTFCNSGGCNAKPALTTTSLTQETISEGHPWLSAKYRGYRGRDIGGAFSTRRYIWEPQYPAEKLFTLQAYVVGAHLKDGNLRSIVPNSAEFTNLYNSVPATSDSVMDSWGTSAIAQVIPTKSETDLAVTAAELISGGLPKMIGAGLLKSQLKDFRKVGDEYLNIEFGLKPLISDIQSTAKSIVTAAERIKQLERDSGRLVRRRFSFPDRRESFETNATGVGAVPAGWTYTYLWNSTAGNRRRTTTTYETKRWFSGAFTYHLNLGERHRNQLYNAADNARLLLGVKLDAEVLWNLAPWSWLADWFGNVGDIATNVSHFSRDGLVMPYGYLMAETSVRKESLLYDLNWRDPTGPKSIRDTAGFVRKQRRPAHPFGFGFTDMVLDTRQTSILGALGISKVPRR
jgi:hypothetical protein